jgi:hypothetical protein
LNQVRWALGSLLRERFGPFTGKFTKFELAALKPVCAEADQGRRLST